MAIIVGIDASRNRSGGAKAHLIGILNQIRINEHRISEIHVWSYKPLLDSLPEYPWLFKHNPKELEKSIFHQIFWQVFHLPIEAKKNKCNIILYTDAGALINFHPSIVMSRDMLSYEKGEMKRFGLSFSRLRLIGLKYIQNISMRKADGVIFLTDYAASVIQNFTGPLKEYRIVSHGVSDDFRMDVDLKLSLRDKVKINCIYVSNTSMYKHQWHVVSAIDVLRKKGYNLFLLLVGGGSGKAQELLNKQIKRIDQDHVFVKQVEYLAHNEIPNLLKISDIFIFASSCENMPNTLIEGMASGLPIVCSNRGPMPEVLKEAGIYFNPELSESIAQAIEEMILNDDLRINLASQSKALSKQFSWNRCAFETFDYINYIFKQKSREPK